MSEPKRSEPKRGARLWRFGTTLLCLSAPALAASRPEIPRPLIQLQGSQFLCTESRVDAGGTVCVKGTYQERMVAIFQNSRAMSMTIVGAYDQAPKPARSTVRDGYLVWRDVVHLHEYLTSIKIENRRGGCNPLTVVPGVPGTSGGSFESSYTIFWYSPDGRRTAIPFGTGYTKRCPPEILDLFNRVVRAGNAIRLP
jgi:hypothetical protein